MPTESVGTAAVEPTDEGSQRRTGFTALPLWGVVVAGALVLIVAGLRETAPIVAPIFLIITLVITMQPLRKVLVRRRFPGWLASLLVLIGIFLMMSVILGAVALSVTQLVYQLPRYEQAFTDIYESSLALLERLGVDTSNLPGLISGIDIGSITGAAQSVLQQILQGITSGFSLFGLMLLAAIFMAFDAASARGRLNAISKLRPATAAAFYDFGVRVRKYWIVTTVFGLIVATIDVVALLIIGVPLAFTWGILAFVSNYIPNVGFVIGLIPPTLIALLEGGPPAALAVLISYTVINFVIQTLIQPRFTGDAAGINATVAFISLIFWASILGILGALLAVPATLFVKVILIDHSPHARWFGALISSDDYGPTRPSKTGDGPISKQMAAVMRRLRSIRSEPAGSGPEVGPPGAEPKADRPAPETDRPS
jgi:predicted PurR-regulated permease PerM